MQLQLFLRARGKGKAAGKGAGNQYMDVPQVQMVEKVLDVPVVHTPEQIIEVPKIQVDQKAVVGKLVERKRLQVRTDLLTGRHRSAVKWSDWSTQIWWQADGDNCCEDGMGCTDGSCEACIDAFEGSRMPSRVMDAAEAEEPEKRRKVSGGRWRKWRKVRLQGHR